MSVTLSTNQEILFDQYLRSVTCGLSDENRFAGPGIPPFSVFESVDMKVNDLSKTITALESLKSELTPSGKVIRAIKTCAFVLVALAVAVAITAIPILVGGLVLSGITALTIIFTVIHAFGFGIPILIVGSWAANHLFYQNWNRREFTGYHNLMFLNPHDKYSFLAQPDFTKVSLLLENLKTAKKVIQVINEKRELKLSVATRLFAEADKIKTDKEFYERLIVIGNEEIECGERAEREQRIEEVLPKVLANIAADY